MNDEDLLDMIEVGDRTKLSLNTLRFYRATGQGPRSFRLGGRVRYKRGDVETWIEQQYGAADCGATGSSVHADAAAM